VKLAIDGGEPAVEGLLPVFNTIDGAEIAAAVEALKTYPLSGYLGGVYRGGPQVEALEDEFSGLVGVKHAVAVNSATSGLLAACYACGMGDWSQVLTTPYTMSATAAAPAHLGATVMFGDIEGETFTLSQHEIGYHQPDIAIVTNLFGHPAHLQAMKERCGSTTLLIEDNAQAPFAMEGSQYAGCIGDIGVFSLNVHKHLQCGEGGICVTNNTAFASAMRRFRNHDELFPGSIGVGLNLRMTEVTAAIARAQLAKKDRIIASRIELAEELTDMVRPYSEWCRPPVVREGCQHVYYCWPLLIPSRQRDRFVDAINAEGVPLRKGYVTPLHKFPGFQFERSNCPKTEMVEDMIALFEVCAWDPTAAQRKQMQEAFAKCCEFFSKS